MPYGLDEFCTDLHRILRQKQLAGLPEIAEKLRALVVDPAFVAATFEGVSAPQRVLFHDPEMDALCASPRAAGRQSRPAAQPRRVLGGLCQCSRGHPDDGMASRQS